MNSRFFRQKVNARERDQRYYDDSYRLLPQDENSDGEDGRSINLRPKRPTNHYIEHMLQSGDTLSSLALRYNCSVAQIKQANNLLRENEVFALRSVRIPVPFHSSLREEVPGIHSPVNAKKLPRQDEKEENVTSIAATQINRVEDNGVHYSDDELHNPLLTPIPLPTLPLVDLSESGPPDLDLSATTVHVKKEPDTIFHCNGDDCGISWVALVLCTLVLGFAGPLIYVFFLYEHEHGH